MTDTDILAFVKARIAEDEQTALAAGETDPERCWRFDDERRTCKVIDGTGDTVVYDEGSPNEGQAAHIVRHDPSRVLREVAAKRRMLAAVERWHDPHPGLDCTNADDPWAPCELHAAATGRLDPYVLKLLAGIWSDHPDYNPSWSTDG